MILQFNTADAVLASSPGRNIQSISDNDSNWANCPCALASSLAAVLHHMLPKVQSLASQGFAQQLLVETHPREREAYLFLAAILLAIPAVTESLPHFGSGVRFTVLWRSEDLNVALYNCNIQIPFRVHRRFASAGN